MLKRKRELVSQKTYTQQVCFDFVWIWLSGLFYSFAERDMKNAGKNMPIKKTGNSLDLPQRTGIVWAGYFWTIFLSLFRSLYDHIFFSRTLTPIPIHGINNFGCIEIENERLENEFSIFDQSNSVGQRLAHSKYHLKAKPKSKAKANERMKMICVTHFLHSATVELHWRSKTYKRAHTIITIHWRADMMGIRFQSYLFLLLASLFIHFKFDYNSRGAVHCCWCCRYFMTSTSLIRFQG